jgi:hypothetical protein
MGSFTFIHMLLSEILANPTKSDHRKLGHHTSVRPLGKDMSVYEHIPILGTSA